MVNSSNPIQVKATREGLVGGTTSCGWIIDNHVSFVALPAVHALNGHIFITNPLTGLSTVAEVLDTGPWNINDDDYVFGGQRPQAETGIDLYGRETNKAGIDLGEKVYKALGMKGNTDVIWRHINK